MPIVSVLLILLVTSSAHAGCRSYEDVEVRVFRELRRMAEETGAIALKPIGDTHRAGTQFCEHRFFVTFLARHEDDFLAHSLHRLC
jgi:hypothetical protein